MENGAEGASSGPCHDTVLRLPLVMCGSREAGPEATLRQALPPSAHRKAKFLPDQWFPSLSAGQSSASGSELLIAVSTSPTEKLLSLRQPSLGGHVRAHTSLFLPACPLSVWRKPSTSAACKEGKQQLTKWSFSLWGCIQSRRCTHCSCVLALSGVE